MASTWPNRPNRIRLPEAHATSDRTMAPVELAECERADRIETLYRTWHSATAGKVIYRD